MGDHGLILYSIVFGPGVLGLVSAWRNPRRYGWIGGAGGLAIAALSPFSGPPAGRHSDDPMLLVLAGAWVAGTFYAGLVAVLLVRRALRSDPPASGAGATMGRVGIVCLVFGLPLGWAGAVAALPNLVGRAHAWSALDSAMPADARILHEEIHACGNGADDPIGPPYCGSARLRVPGVDGARCEREIVDRLTGHGYQVLSTPLAPVDAFNGKDEIRVRVDPWCRAEIDYERNAVATFSRVVAQRRAQSSLDAAIPPGATVLQENVEACTPGSFDPPYCARAQVLLAGEGDPERCRREMARRLEAQGYAPRGPDVLSLDFVRSGDEISISVAAGCSPVEIAYGPRH